MDSADSLPGYPYCFSSMTSEDILNVYIKLLIKKQFGKPGPGSRVGKSLLFSLRSWDRSVLATAEWLEEPELGPFPLCCPVAGVGIVSLCLRAASEAALMVALTHKPMTKRSVP